MDRSDADSLRRAYADKVLARAGCAGNAALRDAFATVRRENFLGPPPFWTLNYGQPLSIAPDDLEQVYSDVLFVLDAEKGINNGEPSLHALLIDALAPQPGDSIAHIGAGTGYYTAILAELVGPEGHVLAVEADARLGGLARDNLGSCANTQVITGDGARYPEAVVDGIYVSFAVAAPAARWLDRLAPGGRLIFPLGVPQGGWHGVRYADRGAMLAVTRQGGAYAARFICPVAFVFGVADAGATKPDDLVRLERAFRSGRMGEVRSLVRNGATDPQRCWFLGADWSLSYDPPCGDA